MMWSTTSYESDLSYYELRELSTETEIVSTLSALYSKKITTFYKATCPTTCYLGYPIIFLRSADISSATMGLVI